MRAVALLLFLAGTFGVAALWQSRRVARLEEEREFARRVEAGEVRATSEEEIPAGWATVVLGGTSPARNPQTVSAPTRVAPEPQPEPAAPQAPNPDFEVIVEPGQSLSKIARAHYATAPVALVRALAEYNGLADEGSLRAGQTLRLPPIETLLPESAAAGSQAPPSIESASQPPAPSPDAELVVEPGQSLSKIARAHYGTAPVALVRALARYNGLADEGALRAGQTLRLPPLEVLQR